MRRTRVTASPAAAFWFGACAALMASAALAEDVPGSGDHPLVGRYEEASIVHHKHSDFDEAALLAAPHDHAALLEAGRPDDRSGPEWLQLEGAVTEIRYEIPAGRSSLEVMRNYEAALEAAGLSPLFECVDQACFAGTLRDPYLMGELVDPSNGISTAYFDRARYLLAHGQTAQGEVHAAVLVGEDKDRVTAFVRVVETRGMETGKIVFVDAPAMQAAIEQAGSVSLYGILFDTGEAALKPQSKQTLDEIDKLLKADPALELEIVGHTDNVGGEAYNLDLSLRRAASVVSALTTVYGVSAGRLSSSGAGFALPVASNDTEEGRARNRRVELKAR